MSAWSKFNTDAYYCTGSQSSAATCQPTNYSNNFKTNCPDACRYAFDDATSNFSCKSTNYIVKFC